MDAHEPPLCSGEHGHHPRRALLARWHGEQLGHETADDERRLPCAVVSGRRGKVPAEEALRSAVRAGSAVVPAYRGGGVTFKTRRHPSAEECAMFVLFDDPREHADGMLDILKFYFTEAMIG